MLWMEVLDYDEVVFALAENTREGDLPVEWKRQCTNLS